MARARHKRLQTGLSLLAAWCMCAAPVSAHVAKQHGAPSCAPDPVREEAKSSKKKKKKTARESAQAKKEAREARAAARKQRRAEKKKAKKKRAAAASPAPIDHELDRLGPAPLELETTRPTPPPPPVVAESEDVEPAEVADTECSEADSESCPSPAVLTASLAVYTGFTMRSIDLPTISGPALLDTGAVPSLALQLGARLTSDPFVGVTLTYHHSLGAEATQVPSDPVQPALTTSIQSHHFEGGVIGGLYLGRGPGSATLAMFLGYGVRAFGSEVELRVPRYSLHGPLARIELELPLGTPWLVLRVAPEVQLIAFISDDLASQGVSSPIWSFGGEAGLQLRVSKAIALQLSYREAHAVVDSVYGGSFSDIERFGLLGLVVDYL